MGHGPNRHILLGGLRTLLTGRLPAWTLLAGGLLAGGAILATSPAAAESYESSTTVEDVLAKEIAGDPSHEAKVQIYKIKPGVSLPWHIHPDAQEIVYVIKGPFEIEIEGEGTTALGTGETFYLAPNLVHRGKNPSAHNTAELYTIRLKPKAAPLVKELGK